MFGLRFEHLFPSPGLNISSSNNQNRKENQPHRANYHMNPRTLNTVVLD